MMVRFGIEFQSCFRIIENLYLKIEKKTFFFIQGCMTKDGPDPNKPCVFPFIDRGISHSKCTFGASDLQPWCPTEVDQNGHYIDEKWGNCDSNCETGNTRFFSLSQGILVVLD